MSTYADMRARIADELANDGDISTTQINRAIQSTIAEYSGEPFWFNTKSIVFSTLASGEYYESSPTSTFEGIIHIDSAVVTSGGIKMPMAAIDSAQIDDVQTGAVLGVPRFYARVFNKIRLYPIPDAEYSVTMAIVYTLDALVDDTDTNAWMNEAEEVIRQGAKKRLGADILQSDEIYARCARMESAAYTGLRAENRQRRSQQYLRTEVPLSRSTFNIYTGQ